MNIHHAIRTATPREVVKLETSDYAEAQRCAARIVDNACGSAIERVRIDVAGEPNADQLDAIRRFARKHGRIWKADLRQVWANQTVSRTDDDALLRQVRNRFGNAWLHGFHYPVDKVDVQAWATESRNARRPAPANDEAVELARKEAAKQEAARKAKAAADEQAYQDYLRRTDPMYWSNDAMRLNVCRLCADGPATVRSMTNTLTREYREATGKVSFLNSATVAGAARALFNRGLLNRELIGRHSYQYTKA